ncbi:ABC transporter permease, partial [Candidatus Micrarchaeota archaeon]|nr:ABC transporter permease [Candidatus Micrarchaeota archaeon]
MKSIEIVKYAIKSIRQRQIRSGLTMLGIIIGIAAVMSLLTIGEGFNQEIENQLASFGSNTVFIIPISESQSGSAALSGGPGTSPSAGKLFEKDAERLKKIGE